MLSRTAIRTAARSVVAANISRVVSIQLAREMMELELLETEVASKGNAWG